MPTPLSHRPITVRVQAQAGPGRPRPNRLQITANVYAVVGDCGAPLVASRRMSRAGVAVFSLYPGSYAFELMEEREGQIFEGRETLEAGERGGTLVARY